MNIDQFMIYLMIEENSESSDGRIYKSHRCIEVDLIDGDLQNFLSSIPDTFGDNSQIWISIKAKNGNRVSFVDGLDERVPGFGWTESIGIERAEQLRRNASVWADRALERKLSADTDN